MIQEDGSVDGSDFCLRSARPDELGLSVTWLEAFGLGKNHQFGEFRRSFRLRLRPKGRFAEMNVGTGIREVGKELDALRVVHDLLAATERFDAFPSHAEIIGLPPGASDQTAMVGDLLVECVVYTHAAISERPG